MTKQKNLTERKQRPVMLGTPLYRALEVVAGAVATRLEAKAQPNNEMKSHNPQAVVKDEQI